MNVAAQAEIDAIDILITKLKHLLETHHGKLALGAWKIGDAYCPIGTILNVGDTEGAAIALTYKSCCSLKAAYSAIGAFIGGYDKHYNIMDEKVIPASSDRAMEAVLDGIKKLEERREYLQQLDDK